ncbi:MAG: group I intron-associated PD-(D/E)XK endonuclease [Nitriliruptorales bacterium]
MDEVLFPGPSGRDPTPPKARSNGAKPRREHPKDVGDTTTAHVLARLSDRYPYVYVPWGENTRTDLLVETEEGDFIRIQCKTGRLRNGAITFPTCSVTYHHPNNRGTDYYRHHYRGQADLFGVYCPETDAVYLVPVDEVGVRSAALRVAPTRNNQGARIRWAEDYKLPPG